MAKLNSEQLAQSIFGSIPKDQLPSADQVLKALEVAKGTKIRVSPSLLERYAKYRADTQGGAAAEEDSCGRCDYDWHSCAACDVPDDQCKECDALDCFPGISGDQN